MTARKFLNRLGGFTLVELLIVIAILGIIALIVIAAINPIEQANRARDTGKKSDAAQLISAIDRYFAAKNNFPWVDFSTPPTYANEDPYGYVTAGTPGVGLCADAACTDGLLISSDELKPEFKEREFVSATSAEDQMMIGKNTGSSSSVYVCYIPLSKSNRQKAVQDGVVWSLDAANGTKVESAACDLDTANWITNLCYVCVPE